MSVEFAERDTCEIGVASFGDTEAILDLQRLNLYTAENPGGVLSVANSAGEIDSIMRHPSLTIPVVRDAAGQVRGYILPIDRDMVGTIMPELYEACENEFFCFDGEKARPINAYPWMRTQIVLDATLRNGGLGQQLYHALYKELRAYYRFIVSTTGLDNLGSVVFHGERTEAIFSPNSRQIAGKQRFIFFIDLLDQIGKTQWLYEKWKGQCQPLGH